MNGACTSYRAEDTPAPGPLHARKLGSASTRSGVQYLVVIALTLLHLATGYLDIAYTTGRRYISPPEQHAHSYMEMLPLAATALLVIFYWSSFAAIFNGDAASWIVTRRQPPPAWALAAIAVGTGAAGVAIVEEYFRCVRRITIAARDR